MCVGGGLGGEFLAFDLTLWFSEAAQRRLGVFSWQVYINEQKANEVIAGA